MGEMADYYGRDVDGGPTPSLLDHDIPDVPRAVPIEDFETRMLRMEADMRERLLVDPEALQKAFVECSAEIAHVGAVYARATQAHLRAKIKVKKMWALCSAQAREDFDVERAAAQLKEDARVLEKGEKREKIKSRVTEPGVEAEIWSNPRYLAAAEEEADADSLRILARANLDAVMARKDCLVQLGAGQRAEMERDPVIRDRARAQRSQRTDHDEVD